MSAPLVAMPDTLSMDNVASAEVYGKNARCPNFLVLRVAVPLAPARENLAIASAIVRRWNSHAHLVAALKALVHEHSSACFDCESGSHAKGTVGALYSDAAKLLKEIES